MSLSPSIISEEEGGTPNGPALGEAEELDVSPVFLWAREVFEEIYRTGVWGEALSDFLAALGNENRWATADWNLERRSRGCAISANLNGEFPSHVEISCSSGQAFSVRLSWVDREKWKRHVSFWHSNGPASNMHAFLGFFAALGFFDFKGLVDKEGAV